MEYGIDNKSKYTTLQIRTTLDCKKKDTDANPPGGMGNGLERDYSELFLLPAVKISEK